MGRRIEGKSPLARTTECAADEEPRLMPWSCSSLGELE